MVFHRILDCFGHCRGRRAATHCAKSFRSASLLPVLSDQASDTWLLILRSRARSLEKIQLRYNTRSLIVGNIFEIILTLMLRFPGLPVMSAATTSVICSGKQVAVLTRAPIRPPSPLSPELDLSIPLQIVETSPSPSPPPPPLLQDPWHDHDYVHKGPPQVWFCVSYHQSFQEMITIESEENKKTENSQESLTCPYPNSRYCRGIHFPSLESVHRSELRLGWFFRCRT